MKKIGTAIIGAAVILTGLFCISCAEEKQDLNVLIVVMDTVRRDGMSVRYAGKSLTPNFDALASEGVRFTRAFSNAPWTLPSHGSIFTGLYPFQHHAVMNNLYLSTSFLTLAEAFKAAGYRTGGFSCNPWISRMTMMDQGFDVFKELFKDEEPYSGSAATTDQAVRWLSEGAADRPFFLFINYINAHLPYNPPPEFISKLFPDGRSTLSRHTFSIEEYEEVMVGNSRLTAEDFEEIRHLYDAEISHVDDQLGQLIEGLRARQILDRTVVIVTSDHGEHMGENNFLGHDFSIHQVLLGIPMVIRYPDRFPGGKRVDANISLVDIFPTLVSLAGLNPSLLSGLPGRDLADLTAREEPDRDALLLLEYHKPQRLIQSYWKPRHPDHDFSPLNLGYKVLIRDNLKFVFRDDGEEFLYDLEKDPAEEKNLAPDKPAFCKNFREQLFEILRKEGRTLREETVVPDEETREKLHALGYL
jgi:arylsulfatase A-like enzyme